jgi:hypothetical protein
MGLLYEFWSVQQGCAGELLGLDMVHGIWWMEIYTLGISFCYLTIEPSCILWRGYLYVVL